MGHEEREKLFQETAAKVVHEPCVYRPHKLIEGMFVLLVTDDRGLECLPVMIQAATVLVCVCVCVCACVRVCLCWLSLEELDTNQGHGPKSKDHDSSNEEQVVFVVRLLKAQTAINQKSKNKNTCRVLFIVLYAV